LFFSQYSGFQEPYEQPIHPTVADTPPYALHQPVVIDVIETALDVSFDDPLVGHRMSLAICRLGSGPHGHADVFQSTVASSPGPKPVRYVPKLSLEDRLQDLLDRSLNDAVLDSRNPQGPEFPWFASLRDQFAPAGARAVAAVPQFLSEPGHKRYFTFRSANTPNRPPVDAR